MAQMPWLGQSSIRFVFNFLCNGRFIGTIIKGGKEGKGGQQKKKRNRLDYYLDWGVFIRYRTLWTQTRVNTRLKTWIALTNYSLSTGGIYLAIYTIIDSFWALV